MIDNLILFEEYKKQSYEISHLEFEALSIELLLYRNLNETQIKLFEKYKNCLSELSNKKESMAFEFAIDSLSKTYKI